jgi:chromosome segregation ATPase
MYHVLAGGIELTRVTDILEDLRKNVSLPEIREKYPSKSQTYEAFRQYLMEANKAINDRRQCIAGLDAKIEQAKKELKDVQNAKEMLSGELQKKQAKSDQLTAQNRKLEEKRNWLQNHITAMNAAGYNPAILKKIARVEAREGPTLWADIKNVARCRNLPKEIHALKKGQTQRVCKIRTE